MAETAPIPETAILDSAQAEAMAYAEKPQSDFLAYAAANNIGVGVKEVIAARRKGDDAAEAAAAAYKPAETTPQDREQARVVELSSSAKKLHEIPEFNTVGAQVTFGGESAPLWANPQRERQGNPHSQTDAAAWLTGERVKGTTAQEALARRIHSGRDIYDYATMGADGMPVSMTISVDGAQAKQVESAFKGNPGLAKEYLLSRVDGQAAKGRGEYATEDQRQFAQKWDAVRPAATQGEVTMLFSPAVDQVEVLKYTPPAA